MKIKDIFRYTAGQVLSDRPVDSDNNIGISPARAQYPTLDITRLLDDAQDIMAKDSFCLEDKDTLGISEYPLPNDGSNIIELDSSVIQLLDDQQPYIEDRTDADPMKWPRSSLTRTFHRTSMYAGSNPIPIVYYYVAQGETRLLYVEPVPKQDNLFINIPVIRKPLVRFTPATGETPAQRNTRIDQECELPIEFHRDLAIYANIQTIMWRKLDKQGKADFQNLKGDWQRAKVDLRLDIYRQRQQGSRAIPINYWF